jgi:PhnB protein
MSTHKVNPIPEGYHSVSPYLTVNDAAGAIDFYKRAFGAKETVRMPRPDGKISHAELRIGDSTIMLADEGPMNTCRSPKALGGTTVNLFFYVNDVDSVYKQAVAAGARAVTQPTNMFWGDRFGSLNDPYGHAWSLATHVEDVAPAEMERRGKEFMAQQQKAAAPQYQKASGD